MSRPRCRLHVPFAIAGWLLAAVCPAELAYQGVSLAGAEFGEGALPGTYGTHYIYPGQSEVDYFLSRDMNVIRLPFRWERLQQTLHGAFDATEQSRLQGFVEATTAKGAFVILDPHNYARYHGQLIGSEAVPHEAFADFWRRLALLFKDNPRVLFGLMNEPHDMPTEQWRAAANAALAAIRGAGATQLVLVCGNGWSGGHSWAQNWYGTPNAVAMLEVVDPGDNFAFEIHQYLDADSSGTSSTAVSTTIGSQRLAGVTAWLRQHGHRAFLGEFGGAGDAISLAAIGDQLDHLEAHADVWLGWCWWAAGPWWGDDYFLLLRPPAGGQDRPQLAALRPHLPLRPPLLDYHSASQVITFPSRAGYRYLLQSSGDLRAWADEGAPHPGTGAVMTLPAAPSAPLRFFRLQVTRP